MVGEAEEETESLGRVHENEDARHAPVSGQESGCGY